MERFEFAIYAETNWRNNSGRFNGLIPAGRSIGEGSEKIDEDIESLDQASCRQSYMRFFLNSKARKIASAQILLEEKADLFNIELNIFLTERKSSATLNGNSARTNRLIALSQINPFSFIDFVESKMKEREAGDRYINELAECRLIAETAAQVVKDG